MSRTILIFVLTITSYHAQAEAIVLSDIYNNKSLAITFENDVFTYKIRDRYYSNGVFFTYKNNYTEDSNSRIYKTSNSILDFTMRRNDLDKAKNSFQVLLAQLMIMGGLSVKRPKLAVG